MRPLVAVPFLLLLLASSGVHAMRCGNRLVGEGDQDFQVRDRCGEPFWTDRYTNVEIVGARTPIERQTDVQFDVWYYNFGPRQLMRRFVFRDGRMLREETLGYGFDALGENCPRLLDGLSSGELVARCGEPVSRRIRNDTVVRRPVRGVEQWIDQRREEWIYDDSDDVFVRVVQLEHGNVSGIDRARR
ncbi:MAG: DUF2845 domain-containing protein [Dokdonella sp.]|uniref:DUF2845 domain-containing protein n=1 Tax=Dokdonella sp. TaxID=2291710 RepID=UPI0032639CDB